MSDWNNPQDLHSGDEIDIRYCGNYVSRGRVKCLSSLSTGLVAFVTLTGGTDYILSMGCPGMFGYEWRRTNEAPTLPTMRAAQPVEYGVNCSRCGERYEHAERVSGFVCTPCRSWIC